jgi:uncharacterized protein
MTRTSQPSSLAPTAPGERIDAMDIVRGFALLGIFLLNIEFFTRPLQDINAEGIDSAARGLDYVVEWATYFFVQNKFWTLFALLFGMGFTVMIDRADRAGRPFVLIYLRRTLALFAIGLAHALLIWSGDILLTYAIAAVLLLVARQARRAWRRWRDKAEPAPMSAAQLAGWGIALYVAPLLLLLAVGIRGTARADLPVKAERQAEIAASMAEDLAVRNRAEQAYSEGSYRQGLDQRLQDTAAQLVSTFATMPWTLGIFLLGAAIVRSGALWDIRAHQGEFRRMRNWGLLAGFALMAISMQLGTATPTRMRLPGALQLVTLLMASLVLALAYGATLVTCLGSRAGPWMKRWLAPAGRMALTNYLLQSVVGTLLFYQYGLGLWGQMSRAWQFALVVVVFALQLVLSRWWLDRFRFGPVEWLWRWATYGRRPAMR